jgi:GntR family transcriptional repressor for pyruvate dehydrogenase complex
MTSAGRSVTRAHELADELRQEIIARQLDEGELFMTEGQISERYGVSRNITREAVSRLRAIGAIESLQAKGLMASRSDPVELFASSLPFYTRDLADLKQLGRFRYTIEVGAVDLIIANATDAQIDQLQRCAERFAAIESCAANIDKINEADLAFHCQFLAGSGNALITGMHKVLSDFFHAETRHGLLDLDPERIQLIPWEHHAIVDAMRNRDTEQCRAVVRQHLRAWVTEDAPSQANPPE